MWNSKSNRRNPLEDQQGFTLIELLLGITVFAIGLLAVAAMQVSAIRGNRLGGEWSRAAALAQMQVEALKTGDIVSGSLSVNGTYNDPNNPIDETGASGGIYTRTWQVANNTTFSKRVTIRVTWNQGGISHTVSLTTVTKGGGI